MKKHEAQLAHERKDTIAANYYAGVIRHAKGWRPAWADAKPGERPELPTKPPQGKV